MTWNHDMTQAPRDGTVFVAWFKPRSSADGFYHDQCRYNKDGVFETHGRIDYDLDGWEDSDLMPVAWFIITPPETPNDRP